MARTRARHWWIHGALLLAGVASPAWAAGLRTDALPFPKQQRVSDDELDRLRGGFVLPNGMDVSVGIDIETLVNGILALRTVLSTANGGVPVVFTSSGNTPAATSSESVPSITIPGVGVIRVANGSAAPAAAGSEQQLTLTPNGAAQPIPSGSVQLTKDDNGSTVSLHGESFEIRHMIGNFTGSLVANSANNISIDTVTTVNVDLKNSTVPIDNTMLRWEAVAIDAAGRGVR